MGQNSDVLIFNTCLAHRLAGESSERFDPKLNSDQLQQCLSKLLILCEHSQGTQQKLSSSQGDCQEIYSSQGAQQEISSSQGGIQEISSSQGGIQEISSSQGDRQEISSSQGAQQEISSSQGGIQEISSSQGDIQEISSRQGTQRESVTRQEAQQKKSTADWTEAECYYLLTNLGRLHVHVYTVEPLYKDTSELRTLLSASSDCLTTP